MDKNAEFVSSLISQMTVREKIGQLSMVVSGMNTYDKVDGKIVFVRC